MKTTIVRTYKKGYDVIDKFVCPYCRCQQELYEDVEVTECINCLQKVRLIRRIFRGKNF